MKSRFFWTQIDADFVADSLGIEGYFRILLFLILSVLIHNPNQRKINQLNTEVWNERKSRKIDGFPVLPETMYETDLLSGNNVSWRVSVYENF